jgi:L-ascorbate metabolism protein UlaG (beta-lactamase superfamily)
VYFIGNATTSIRFGGLTILTDPAFLHTKASTSIWATAYGRGVKSSRHVRSLTCHR